MNENLKNNQLDQHWYLDKTPELALFYNLAYDRIERFIKTEDKNVSDNAIKSLFNNEIPNPDLNIGTFIKLKNYLWKGYNDDKNSSGTGITEKEISIIRKILYRLTQIRNFQSHYYHSNEPLKFDHDLRIFIQDLFKYAKGKLSGANLHEIHKFDKNFNKRKEDYNKKNANKSTLGQIFNHITDNGKNDYYLNSEGKNFFLSLFLTTGEMKKFLKQRRGSKRDDTKEFTIKHALYTFYCHRDGATRFHYNQEENFLESHEAISKEILKKRQVYKINTYLNDVPESINDPSLFPLFDDKDNIITEPLDLIKFCKVKNIFNVLSFELATKLMQDKQVKTFEHTIEIKHASYPECKIWVGITTFHKLIIDAIRLGAGMVENDVVKFCIERQRIMMLLADEFAFKTEREADEKKLKEELNEYELFKLRTDEPKVLKNFSAWCLDYEDKIDVMNKGFIPTREHLENKLKETPITLRYLDFYYEKERKPRQKNEFVRYAVQYFIDHNRLPDVCWQWQAFETITDNEGKQVLTEITCYQPQKPKGKWRLKFTHDHQILFTYNQPTDPNAKDEKKKEAVQCYLAGHRVIKNLLIADLNKVNPKKIKGFFIKLSLYVPKLYKGETEGLQLLDENSIPTTFNNLEKLKQEKELKERTQKRIEALIEKLKASLENPPKRRADKNRTIMQCYRLFDWDDRKSNGVEMYLRQNEYNQLSIYHYMLEKKKLINILDEIKAGNENRIPDQVLKLLTQSKDLDDLYTKTLDATIEHLRSKCELLNLNKLKIIKEIARKIGVAVYEGGKKFNQEHVPFDIHPMLPIKALYGSELEKNGGKFSLSSLIWKDFEWQNVLCKKHYKAQAYFDYFGGDAGFEGAKKNIKKKIIGAMNETITQDALLFMIGQQYDDHYKQVENMHEMEFDFLDMNKINKTFAYKIEDANPEEISVEVSLKVKYKQLDDILIAVNPNRFQKSIHFYLKEKKIQEPKLDLSFIEIKQQMDKVYHESLGIIHAIFQWEEKVVNSKISEALNIANKKETGLPHLNFSDLLKIENILSNDLNLIRVHALHSKMPGEKVLQYEKNVTFTYEYLTENWTYKNINLDPCIGSYYKNYDNYKKEKRAEQKEKYKKEAENKR